MKLDVRIPEGFDYEIEDSEDKKNEYKIVYIIDCEKNEIIDDFTIAKGTNPFAEYTVVWCTKHGFSIGHTAEWCLECYDKDGKVK